MNPAPGIAVYRATDLITDAEAEAACVACDAQMREDFCPAWSRLPIGVQFFPDPKTIPAGMPAIALSRDAQAPGALAWHSEQASGRIVGVVGIQTCRDAGEDWRPALSHEITEAARNPFVNGWTTMPGHGGKRKVANEVADPVQDGSYEKAGGVVSNFVLPSWFDADGVAPFDFLGQLTRPFSKTEGGYFEIDTAGVVTQEGMKPPHRSRVRHGAVEAPPEQSDR